MHYFILTTIVSSNKTSLYFSPSQIQNRLKQGHEPYKYDPYGDDLTTISIQRQRDCGMPGYNEFRKYSGLKTVNTFEELGDEIEGEVSSCFLYKG